MKDLSKLGRKLEKIICVDHDPEAFRLQQENGIVIRPFHGDPNDTEILDLLDFLKAAGTQTMQQNEDTRALIQKFGAGDVDIGRRYLVYKKEQDERVASRRILGRSLSGRTNPSLAKTKMRRF